MKLTGVSTVLGVVVLVLWVTLGGFLVHDWIREPLPFRTVTGENYVIIAGTIRPDADCHWTLVRDEHHKPTGIGEVITKDGGSVVVKYAADTRAVVSFVATPDESLVQRGIQVGASVSSDEARITIGPNVDCSDLGEWANVWVYGLMRD